MDNYNRNGKQNDPFYQAPPEREHPVIDRNQSDFAENERKRFREETASELTEPIDERQQTGDQVNNVYGWIAVGSSIISFFFIPLLFAIAGIILGVVARNREAPLLGYTAIVLGVLSILVRLFILPLL